MGVDFEKSVYPAALANNILYLRLPVYDFDRIDQASTTATPQHMCMKAGTGVVPLRISAVPCRKYQWGGSVQRTATAMCWVR